MLHSRIERIQALLQEEIARIVDKDLNNPNLPEFITIFQVKVSKDLSRALVLITFLQDQTPEVIDQTLHELNHSAGFIGATPGQARHAQAPSLAQVRLHRFDSPCARYRACVSTN